MVFCDYFYVSFIFRNVRSGRNGQVGLSVAKHVELDTREDLELASTEDLEIQDALDLKTKSRVAGRRYTKIVGVSKAPDLFKF